MLCLFIQYWWLFVLNIFFCRQTYLLAYASLGYGFTSYIRLISCTILRCFCFSKYIYTGHAAINNFDMPVIFVGEVLRAG